MGLLSKITGGADRKLMQNGVVGRGIITELQLTGSTMQVANGLVQRTCIFTVEVSLDEEEPYMAKCKQRLAEIQIPQIQPGATMVAVRVDPEDRDKIVLDLASPPPTITAPARGGDHSAAYVMAHGRPGRAVIVDSQSIGKRNQEGVDIYAFTLTVMVEGEDPYQIHVGNPTPPAALPFLFPGSRVPVKVGTVPNAVIIDWEAAAAEAGN